MSVWRLQGLKMRGLAVKQSFMVCLSPAHLFKQRQDQLKSFIRQGTYFLAVPTTRRWGSGGVRK